MDKRVLEEFAALLQGQKRGHVDEVVVVAFGFAGTRRTRRVGHRQPDPGFPLEQRVDHAALAAA